MPWITRTCIALVLLSSAAAQEPDTQVLADHMWAEFERISWDASYSDWINSRPGAACETPQSDGYSSSLQWCNQCTAESAGQTQQWTFYALDLRAPLACRLVEYDIRSAEGYWEPLARVYEILRQRLTARFGLGQRNSAIPAHFPQGFPPGWAWNTESLDIWLHLHLSFPEERRNAVVNLTVRRSGLDQENRLSRFEFDVRPELTHYRAFGTPMDLALADALQSEFPVPAEMLRKQIATPTEEQVRAAMDFYFANRQAANANELRRNIGRVPQWTPAVFFSEAMRLLNSAGAAAPERRVALLLGADRLLTRILYPNGMSRAELLDEWLKELEQHGVTFENLRGSDSKFPPVWEYDHDLLWRAWEEFPNAEWGQWAFVALLEHGWHTKPTCGGSSDPSQLYLNNRGDDHFVVVIEQGENFLRERRPSRLVHRELLLLLAQAYETWWSLSRATADNYVPDHRKYQDGAEAARQRAIEYYEQVLRQAPETDLSAYAMRHLPRLKLQVDTNQRRFHCAMRH